MLVACLLLHQPKKKGTTRTLRPYLKLESTGIGTERIEYYLLEK